MCQLFENEGRSNCLECPYPVCDELEEENEKWREDENRCKELKEE